MNVEQIYKDSKAMLNGHFLLSSGNHSSVYLQSAKVLEDPKTATKLATKLAEQIKQSGLKIDTVCSPALGGLIAGYALAQALDVRFIFAERVDKQMTIRRGFTVSKNEKVLICEDIITTGGSALEAASQVEVMGGDVVAYAALANRGFCKRENSDNNSKSNCKLPSNIPFFALADFTFEMYAPQDCPMCKDGKSNAIKPGSRGN
jgi:orotate phosphoribosyltransferase